MEADDPIAIFNHGCWYNEGLYGLPQDYAKALEFYHRAAELGYSKSYCNVGYAYSNGYGVEVDKEKANHYYELAAMGGDEEARHNLGVKEKHAGNMDRALKHHMIAVSGGYSDSLNKIQRLYTNGHATKEDYTKALQSYQTYLSEIKSDARDETAFDNERYRYY